MEQVNREGGFVVVDQIVGQSDCGAGDGAADVLAVGFDPFGVDVVAEFSVVAGE